MVTSSGKLYKRVCNGILRLFLNPRVVDTSKVTLRRYKSFSLLRSTYNVPAKYFERALLNSGSELSLIVFGV